MQEGRHIFGEQPHLCHPSIISKAVTVSFPDISSPLDPAMFALTPREHWRAPENRKTFFEKLAHKKGFALSDPANWCYAIETSAVLEEKDGPEVLRYYKGSVARALLHLFPMFCP